MTVTEKTTRVPARPASHAGADVVLTAWIATSNALFGLGLLTAGSWWGLCALAAAGLFAVYAVATARADRRKERS